MKMGRFGKVRLGKVRFGKTGIIEIILVIVVGIVIAVISGGGTAKAQYPPAYNNYSDMVVTSTPLDTPMNNGQGDVLVDDFEYWDSPMNHGWTTNEPPYPVWGVGNGYGSLQTLFDSKIVSRVMDVQMPYSVFLPAPDWQLGIQKNIIDPASGQVGVQANILWVSVRSPLEVEQFAMWRMVVYGTTRAAGTGDEQYPFAISFLPTGFNGQTGEDAVTERQFRFEDAANTAANPYTINVDMGRNYEDGTWHTLRADLSAMIDRAAIKDSLPHPDEALEVGQITGIMIFGNRYRLDNLWLMKDSSPIEGEPSYIFKIGPQYTQLFVPFEYYCYAKDPDLTYRVFLDIWQNEFELNGVPPSDARVKDLTEEWIRSRKATHSGYISDPDKIDPDRDKVFWSCNVGGWGAHGSYTYDNLLSEVPIPLKMDQNGNPYRDSAGNLSCDKDVIARIPQLWLNPYKAVIVSLATPYDPDNIADYDPSTVPYLQPGTGGCRIYDPNAVAAYGTYLLNIKGPGRGFKTWPDIARLYYLPQVMEDLMLTVSASDSASRMDGETFPLSVVNYPVTNHPPKLDNIAPQVGIVGEVYRYQLITTDQDWFAPDGSFIADQLHLTWSATINNYPSYQYGPWNESIINPMTGEITFTPQFEGIYDIIVTVTDPRGLSASFGFPLTVENTGTWLNHSPIIPGDFGDSNVFTIKAGQMFILGPPMLDFEDPDGDELYYSCDIGSIALDKDDAGVSRAWWTFQTNLPGFYMVNITAFDQRGGLAVSTFAIDVQPWWAY